MPAQALIEEPTLYRLPVTGMTVARVSADAQLRLELSDEAHKWTARIMIGGGWSCGPPGSLVTCDLDSGDRGSAGIALNLFYAEVTEAIAHKDGRLEVHFRGGRPKFPVDGWILDVPMDADYEPWEVDLPDLGKIVSAPGGELYVFNGKPTGTVGDLYRSGALDPRIFKMEPPDHNR